MRSLKNGSECGSILLAVMILMVFMALLVGAAFALARTSHRVAAEDLDRELAYLQARSGLGYVASVMESDASFLTNSVFPTATTRLGEGGFRLESATPTGLPGEWAVTVTGYHGTSIYTLGGAIGFDELTFPPGVLAVGTGNPADIALHTFGTADIGAYDPADGPFNPSIADDFAEIQVNGSVDIGSNTKILGNLKASGKITKGSTALITGTETAGAEPADVESVDSLIKEMLDTSRVSNDNALIAATVGSSWTPVASSENYGDLLISGGSYTLTAGTYRVRRLELTSGAQLIFDTSGGPVNLVYVGSGAGTGTLNDLTVNSSEFLLDSGGTTNALNVVLGPDCDLKIHAGSTFGQNLSDPDSGGYTRVISLGGNSSSDDIEVTGNSTVYGRVYAPAHDVTITGGSNWFGSVLASTVQVSDTSLFGIDYSSLGITFDMLGQPLLGSQVEIRGDWREVPSDSALETMKGELQ